MSALLWAADMGHLEVVELLLKDGADLHIVDKVCAPRHLLTLFITYNP